MVAVVALFGQCRHSESHRWSDGYVRDKVRSNWAYSSEALHSVSPPHHSRRHHHLHQDPHREKACNKKEKMHSQTIRNVNIISMSLTWGRGLKKEKKNLLLVVTRWMWVVKVTVWVDFAEDAQAQPTEVLLTRGAGHFVTAINFLKRHRNDTLATTGIIWNQTQDFSQTEQKK